MRLLFLSHLSPLVVLTLLVGLPLCALRSWGQVLTPGAAAIGGTTTDGRLIAPNGEQSTTGTSAPATGQRTVHLPDPNWPIVLPQHRLRVQGRALPDAGLVLNAAPAQPTPVTPTEDPLPTPPESPTDAVVPPADSTEVTAGASPTGGSTVPTESVVFDQIALDFGSQGVDLTLQHEIALGPVVDLIRQDPLRPLRVVAVLAQAEATNEEAKLLARRRILAVRRYLIEQGLSADNLTFVISSNATTEPFINNVLIEN